MLAGLRELVDFLPASIATIISYFSAEISRGIWKAVPMNGTDWPSPAPMLPSIESEIKEILAAVGVSVPCCSAGMFCNFSVYMMYVILIGKLYCPFTLLAAAL